MLVSESLIVESARPIVIHTYRNRCKTVAQPPGLGDFLRGSLALANLSTRIGFDLQIDFSAHPIGRFVHLQNIHSQTCSEVAEFFNERTDLLPEYLQRLVPGQRAFLTTNAFPDELQTSDKTRELVRSQLRFNAIVRDRTTAILELIGSPFAIFHLRVADQLADSTSINSKLVRRLTRYLACNVMPRWDRRIAVLSNNVHLKQAVTSQLDLPTINTCAVHLGESKEEDTADNGVRDTLVDFALISQAASIYSYSNYSWKSGFSKQCSELYDVPFTDLRPIIGTPSPGWFAPGGLAGKLLSKFLSENQR
jgi:hypothetical protein